MREHVGPKRLSVRRLPRRTRPLRERSTVTRDKSTVRRVVAIVVMILVLGFLYWWARPSVDVFTPSQQGGSEGAAGGVMTMR